MTTKVMLPGSRFADWSYARPRWSDLQANGIFVGSRYFDEAFRPDLQTGKCASVPELNDGFAHGFAFLANWESSAYDALLGSAKAKQQAPIFLQQLRTVQYDVNPLLKATVSCDTDARSHLPAVRDYFNCFRDLMGEYAPQINAYGGSYECNELADLLGEGWLTTSHAWSDPAVWAAINNQDWSNPILDNICSFQTAVGSTSAYDMDIIIKPVTVWTGIGADPVQAPASEPPATQPVVITPPTQPTSAPVLKGNKMLRVLTVGDATGLGIWLWDPVIGFTEMPGELDATLTGRLTDVNMDKTSIAQLCGLYGKTVPSRLV